MQHSEKWKDWTWQELRRYLRVIKGYSKETVRKRICYLKFLERDFNFNLHAHPDVIYEQFLDFVEWKRDAEGDSAENSIRLAKNAIQALFDFFGVRHQYNFPKTRTIEPDIPIYSDEVAYKIIHGEYSKDPAVNATYQHIFHYCHFVGVRVPSELWAMKVDDIDFEQRKIRIYQQKVRKYRVVYVEPFIITSRVDKSLLNYYLHWRPKLEDAKSKDYFWLNQHGEPFTPDGLRQRLGRYGKKYYSRFYPYLMRHWCATYRLIQSYKRTGIFDIMGVNLFMGHKKIEQTMKYVHIAEKILQEYHKEPKIGRLRIRRGKKNFKQHKSCYLKSFHMMRENPGGAITPSLLIFSTNNCQFLKLLVTPVAGGGSCG